MKHRHAPSTQRCLSDRTRFEADAIHFLRALEEARGSGVRETKRHTLGVGLRGGSEKDWTCQQCT